MCWRCIMHCGHVHQNHINLRSRDSGCEKVDSEVPNIDSGSSKSDSPANGATGKKFAYVWRKKGMLRRVEARPLLWVRKTCRPSHDGWNDTVVFNLKDREPPRRLIG